MNYKSTISHHCVENLHFLETDICWPQKCRFVDKCHRNKVYLPHGFALNQSNLTGIGLSYWKMSKKSLHSSVYTKSWNYDCCIFHAWLCIYLKSSKNMKLTLRFIKNLNCNWSNLLSVFVCSMTQILSGIWSENYNFKKTFRKHFKYLILAFWWD